LHDLRQLFADNLLPLLDIGLVAVLVYYGLVFLRGLRNQTLLWIFTVLAVVYLICQYAGLFTLGLVVSKLLFYGPLLFVVVFGPELRKFIEALGQKSRFWRDVVPASGEAEHAPDSAAIEAVCEAARELALRRTGALMVLHMEDSVDQLAITGTTLDALISSRLLISIFNRHNPLHDGAVLIHDDRIAQAACFLPISESSRVADHLGTRHRAALGLAERCDAVVVIVSEERGTVSIAHNGRIALDLSPAQFREQLSALLSANPTLVSLPPRVALN
jgi:diadenylate cyclase